MKINIISIILIVLSFIGGYYYCNTTIEPIRLIETTTDSIPYPIYLDSIVYVDSIVTIPSNIDTGAILQAYFTKRSFDTTIVVNEVRLKFTGNLLENTLQQPKFIVSNLRPTQIVEKLNRSIMIGGILGIDVFSPTIDYQFNNHVVGVGYNLLSDNRFLISYKYKLFKF